MNSKKKIPLIDPAKLDLVRDAFEEDYALHRVANDSDRTRTAVLFAREWHHRINWCTRFPGVHIAWALAEHEIRERGYDLKDDGCMPIGNADVTTFSTAKTTFALSQDDAVLAICCLVLEPSTDLFYDDFELRRRYPREFVECLNTMTTLPTGQNQKCYGRLKPQSQEEAAKQVLKSADDIESFVNELPEMMKRELSEIRDYVNPALRRIKRLEKFIGMWEEHCPALTKAAADIYANTSSNSPALNLKFSLRADELNGSWKPVVARLNKIRKKVSTIARVWSTN